MLETLLAHEAPIRYYSLLAAFGGAALLESYLAREPVLRAGARWRAGLLLTALGAILVQALLPLLAVALASWCEREGIGALNLVDAPVWLEAAIALVVLDFARYAEHWLLHRVPWLWRLHRVHHSDTEYDASTGLRFHPLEALLTAVLHVAVIVALGASPIVVLAHEVIYAFAAAWAHANLRLPRRLDRALRRVIVTPTLHAVHHSSAPSDANRNFAAFLSVWDRLLGTYADESVRPGRLRYGLGDASAPARVDDLGLLLMLPFASANAAPTNAVPPQRDPADPVAGRSD